MSSAAWHAPEDGEANSDESVALIIPSGSDPNDAFQPYSDDTASTCVRRSTRSARHSIGQAKATQRAKNEKKYKNSLVSILIIGVCLILTVNIGLGFRKCDETQDDSISHHPMPKEHCVDSATGVKFPWQKYRLPSLFFPESYHIFLHPNLTLETYSGNVTIIFTVKRSTSEIILHSKKHVIRSGHLSIRGATGSKKPLKQMLKCLKYETVSLNFDCTLSEGNTYELVLDFSGNLTFSLGGFYLSKYKKKDGGETVIGTTQFESTDARAAFPCFDEPAFKAKFSLSLVRDENMRTLFNMPLLTTKQLKGGLCVDNFKQTVKMSTYLVAFIVSDFENITSTTDSNVEVSIFSAADKLNDTKFALDIAVNVLSYYEKLFKIPFPLPKMDLVAIPDFAAGAMENWGLVTYRETSLLYNSLTSSVTDQEWVASVIAHELSHQWFGNLVTMEWWNDLWLNEGFASYIEYVGVDALKPSWKMMSEIATSTVPRAMSVDSSSYTHPITVSVTNSHEIDEVFDNISYDKGACMIAMLVDFMGETFFKGVNAYLKKFAYGNAGNSDLIQAVAVADDKNTVDVQKMMNTWTGLPGFPFIKVSVSGSQVVVEQTRLLYPTGDKIATSANLWHVPLTYVTSNAPSEVKRHFLTWKTSTVDVPGQFEWIKFNHNFTGYYRVTYDTSNWQKLISQLNTDHTVFTVSDRVSLLSDAFAMARLGEMEYSDLFNMLAYIKNEKEYSPLVTAINGLGYINKIYRASLSEHQHRMFKSYVNDLFSSLYGELAWKDRKGLDRDQSKIQSYIVEQACRYDYKPCMDVAYEKFLQWQKSNTALSPDDMVTIFTSGAKSGKAGDWDHLWSVFTTASDASVKRKLLTSLATSTELERILFLQAEYLKGDTIRSQDVSTLIRSLTSNLVGAPLTWRFVKQHWEDIIKLHPVSSFATRYIVKDCVSTILDDGEIAGAEAFFTLKGISEMKYVKRTLESARVNLYWSKHNLPLVSQWLSEHEKTRTN